MLHCNKRCLQTLELLDFYYSNDHKTHAHSFFTCSVVYVKTGGLKSCKVHTALKRHFEISPITNPQRATEPALLGKNAWNDGMLFLAGDESREFSLVEVSGVRSACIMLMRE